MQKEEFSIVNAECISYMKTMPDNSVDAIITDPPYFKVVKEQWDRQWDKPDEFLRWLGTVLDECARILKPNGSLYMFAYPKYASRVELEISKRFNVLNNITWFKADENGNAIGRGNLNSKEALRLFFPTSERIIFAEPFKSDKKIKSGQPDFVKAERDYINACDRLKAKVFAPLREYLDGERTRAGFSMGDCDNAMGNQMSGHIFTITQWALPTKKNYEILRELFNSKGGDYLKREYDYLKREYDDLKREYDYLKREYDDLKREYESLRRPFDATPQDQWGDVWLFRPVQSKGRWKHPCEKPQALLQHILKISTKPDALIFDPFTGGGSMAEACIVSGRRFIGTEMSKEYHAKAIERAEAAKALPKIADESNDTVLDQSVRRN